MSLRFVEFSSKFCRILSVSLFVPYAMPNLTTEKLEKILNDKLRPLSEQLKQALKSVSSPNTKYENIQETQTKLEKDKEALSKENGSLKAQALSTANDLK